jgi:translation initiation factor IF-3
VLKTVRFGLKIDAHDYGTKRGQIERFLKAGDKVKVIVVFRGREQSRPEMGMKLLQKLAQEVAELGAVESNPSIDGRNMVMVLGPLRNKADAKADAKRAADKAASAAATAEKATAEAVE